MTPPDDTPENRAAARIAIVRARFVTMLPQRVEALCELARRAASEDLAEAKEAGDAVRLGLHNLSGGAPTLGFTELGRRARDLERRFIAARRADGGVNVKIAEDLAREILELRANVN